jgi:DNA gyrase subunit A
MGRATQGVRLINLEKRNDEIASVCKVQSEANEEITAQLSKSVEEEFSNEEQ